MVANLLRGFRLVMLCLALLLPVSGAMAQQKLHRPKAVKPSAKAISDSSAVLYQLRAARRAQQEYHDSEALAIYQSVLKLAPANYEALWQAAVLSVRIGTRYSDETRKAAYFESAQNYAQQALALQPEGGEANYAAGLALSSQAMLLTARSRLAAYKAMRSYAFLAAQQRPDWADAQQLLGRWHFRVVHYNLLERLYSIIFLGGMPSGASSRKAIEALEKAHQLDSTRVQFCYDLARVYRTEGHGDLAIGVLQEASYLPTLTSEELEVSRRCELLLKQLYRRYGIHQEEIPHQ